MSIKRIQGLGGDLLPYTRKTIEQRQKLLTLLRLREQVIDIYNMDNSLGKIRAKTYGPVEAGLPTYDSRDITISIEELERILSGFFCRPRIGVPKFYCGYAVPSRSLIDESAGVWPRDQFNTWNSDKFGFIGRSYIPPYEPDEQNSDVLNGVEIQRPEFNYQGSTKSRSMLRSSITYNAENYFDTRTIVDDKTGLNPAPNYGTRDWRNDEVLISWQQSTYAHRYSELVSGFAGLSNNQNIYYNGDVLCTAPFVFRFAHLKKIYIPSLVSEVYHIYVYTWNYPDGKEADTLHNVDGDFSNDPNDPAYTNMLVWRRRVFSKELTQNEWDLIQLINETRQLSQRTPYMMFGGESNIARDLAEGYAINGFLRPVNVELNRICDSTPNYRHSVITSDQGITDVVDQLAGSTLLTADTNTESYYLIVGRSETLTVDNKFAYVIIAASFNGKTHDENRWEQIANLNVRNYIDDFIWGFGVANKLGTKVTFFQSNWVQPTLIELNVDTWTLSQRVDTVIQSGVITFMPLYPEYDFNSNQLVYANRQGPTAGIGINFPTVTINEGVYESEQRVTQRTVLAVDLRFNIVVWLESGKYGAKVYFHKNGVTTTISDFSTPVGAPKVGVFPPNTTYMKVEPYVWGGQFYFAVTNSGDAFISAICPANANGIIRDWYTYWIDSSGIPNPGNYQLNKFRFNSGDWTQYLNTSVSPPDPEYLQPNTTFTINNTDAPANVDVVNLLIPSGNSLPVVLRLPEIPDGEQLYFGPVQWMGPEFIDNVDPLNVKRFREVIYG